MGENKFELQKSLGSLAHKLFNVGAVCNLDTETWEKLSSDTRQIYLRMALKAFSHVVEYYKIGEKEDNG
jgi:hypothetical protein